MKMMNLSIFLLIVFFGVVGSKFSSIEQHLMIPKIEKLILKENNCSDLNYCYGNGECVEGRCDCNIPSNDRDCKNNFFEAKKSAVYSYFILCGIVFATIMVISIIQTFRLFYYTG